MKAQRVCSALLGLVLVSGVGAIGRPSQPNIPDVSSSPSTSEKAHTLSRIRPHARIRGRDETPQNATDIARSWNGATLFKLEAQVPVAGGVSISGGIEVTCVTCYVKGRVTTEVQYDPDFDITQAVLNFTRDIGEEIENITVTAEHYLNEELPQLFENITDDFDFSDVSLAPLDLSFNVDLPEIPESTLRFQFDDLELYMMLDTVISAGSLYTLNLYSSNTEVGLSRDSETFVGIIASIDLILAADADINIGNGLHIKIDDWMMLELSLFGRNVSNVKFNGGSFEFLPVTVQSVSGVLTAKLRLSMHTGVALNVDSILQSVPWIDVSAGAEAMVYADLAEFTTNITAVPEGDDSDCQIRVQQAYQLALGAAAGATLAVGPETWGPDPSTKVPIFYTTLADVCATSVSKTASTSLVTPTASTPLVSARADDGMTTTTLSEEVIFTGLVCLQTGLAECPLSLRSTTKVISTRTLVTAVPSGLEATFPATTQDAVLKTIPFAKNVEVVSATTGSPVSYVPPPPPTSSSSSSSSSGDGSGRGGSGNNEGGGGGGSGKNLALIIGLSVGLGVPFLAAVLISAFFLLKRRKYAAVAALDTVHVTSPQDYQDVVHTQEKKNIATATASVIEQDGRT